MAATANIQRTPADQQAGNGTRPPFGDSAETTTLRYRSSLDRGYGSTGGAGWVEETVGGPHGGASRRVTAAEAYVVCADGGRGEEILAATYELIAELDPTTQKGARDRARLQAELEDAEGGERVLAAPLRTHLQRALEAGASMSAIAGECGLRSPDGRGDSSALQRRLGLLPNKQRSGRKTWSQTVSYEEAVAIARALGADPFEVGV